MQDDKARKHFGCELITLCLCVVVQETVVGLVMFSLAILGPSGWILANLESYKKKD